MSEQPHVVIGTNDGLYELTAAEAPSNHLPGKEIRCVTRAQGSLLIVVDRSEIWTRSGNKEWERLVTTPGGRLVSMAHADGTTLVGDDQTMLYRLEGERLAPVTDFQDVRGRDEWYTPYGRPPEVRSFARDDRGYWYVNVHVGGIVRINPELSTFERTIDYEADVHEVYFDPGTGFLLAATGRGLAVSNDYGETWEYYAEGLHGSYCRAIRTSGEHLLVTASTGPHSTRAAVYRAPLANPSELVKCNSNLPEFFDSNINTYTLDSAREKAAFGTPAGAVYLSDDTGAGWRQVASDLPRVLSVTFV